MSLESIRGWMQQPQAKRFAAIGGYAIAALCLIWVFHGINYKTLVHQFEVLKPGDLGVAILFTAAVYFVNALRWSLLLRPLAKVGYWRTLQAVYIGLFCNEVLPLRPGELVRCYLLSRWTRLPLSNMFASAAVERVLDGLCMMAGFFAVAPALRLPHSLRVGSTILAAGLVALASIWMFHAARTRGRGDGASGGSQKPLERFLDALASMGSAGGAAQALAASCAALACFILAMWFLMKGGGIEMSLAQAAAVFLIIRVGTVIPAAPGNVGTYQFFCVLALGIFGVDRTAAAAFSVLIYSAFTVPLLIGGCIAVAASGLKFGALLAVESVPDSLGGA